MEQFFGKYRGIVKDIDDPENFGRLRAKVPSVLGDVISPWALPCAPYAGNCLGQYMIPPLDASVWIEFEAGDVSYPIWSGAWWNEDSLPKDEVGNIASPANKIIRTEKGLMLSLNDHDQTIALSDQNGKNLLKIRVKEGVVYLQGTTKVIVEAPKINLAENACHPVVFGDELMIYLTQIVTLFNNHLHPGETLGGVQVTPAPPQPSIPPPTPALFSKKVNSG
jgi:hypothetical protein